MAAEKLLMVCFEARDHAHVAHLRTRSYAAHKALDEFYHGIIDAVDGYIEAYQGVYGLVGECERSDELGSEADPTKLMKKFRAWLVEYREDCCKGQTELENLYDGIIELADTTTYKLRFLS